VTSVYSFCFLPEADFLEKAYFQPLLIFSVAKKS